MKEITSAFQSEIFTPIVTLVAPGAIALSPVAIALLLRHKTAWPFIEKHNVEAWIVTVAITVILGLMLENFGSSIEARIFDKALPKKDGFEKHESEWHSYLRLAFRVEPVGHRYLRILVLHLRFERNSCVAFLGALVGCLYLPISWTARGGLGGVCLLLALYLYWEAKKSHEALSELRRELLKGINVIGDSSASASKAAGAQ